MIQKYVVKRPASTIKLENPHEFFDGLREGDSIPVTVNSERMAAVAAVKMYSSWKSGVRELYANACRAAKEGVAAGISAEARVSVLFDATEDGTRLVISDNGPGMSLEGFEEIFSEIGTSDNADPTSPGQFGVGFISFLLLGERARVDTMYEGPEGPQRYAVTVDEKLDMTYEGDGDRMTHGTTVSVLLTRQKYPEHVAGYIREAAWLSGVRTTVTGKANEGEEGEHPPMDVAAAYEAEHGSPAPVRISTDDYDLAAGWEIDAMQRGSCQTVLAGMPVHADFDPGHNLRRYYLNIKNERKFMPHPSREYMSEEANEALKREICGKVDAEVEALRKKIPPFPKTYDELCDADVELLSLRGMMPERSRCEAWVFEEYFEHVHYHSLFQASRLFGKNVAYSSKERKNREVLEKKLGVVILWGKSTGHDRIAAELKMTTLREAAKKAGIRLTAKRSKDPGKLVDHANGRTYGLDSLPKTTVMAPPGRLREVTGKVLPCHIPDRIGWIKHVPGLEGHPRVVMFEDWIKRIGEVKIRTNRGPMRIREISKADSWCRPSVTNWLHEDEDGMKVADTEWGAAFPHVLLYEGGDKEMLLHAYARYHGGNEPHGFTIWIGD